MPKKYSSIPIPTTDARSLQTAVLALKEVVEDVTGQRGGPPPVTWDDLVRLNLISPQDVPR